MGNLKINNVRIKLPVCILVLPVHSLDDGACHKRNLVEAGLSDLWVVETIRRCIAWPTCGFRSDASAPRFPE